MALTRQQKAEINHQAMAEYKKTVQGRLETYIADARKRATRALHAVQGENLKKDDRFIFNGMVASATEALKLVCEKPGAGALATWAEEAKTRAQKMKEKLAVAYGGLEQLDDELDSDRCRFTKDERIEYGIATGLIDAARIILNKV